MTSIGHALETDICFSWLLFAIIMAMNLIIKMMMIVKIMTMMLVVKKHLHLLVIGHNYHDDDLDDKDFDDDGCMQRAFPQYGKW